MDFYEALVVGATTFTSTIVFSDIFIHLYSAMHRKLYGSTLCAANKKIQMRLELKCMPNNERTPCVPGKAYHKTLSGKPFFLKQIPNEDTWLIFSIRIVLLFEGTSLHIGPVKFRRILCLSKRQSIFCPV